MSKTKKNPTKKAADSQFEKHNRYLEAESSVLKDLASIETPQNPTETEVIYAFPTKSRCPRCGVLDTKAVSTQKRIQYRQCQRAICKWNYEVIGKKV